MKQFYQKTRLYLAGIAALLCGGLAWAASSSGMLSPLASALKQYAQAAEELVTEYGQGSEELALTYDEAINKWQTPQAPVNPMAGEEYVADGTTAYYLYNVGCGQFVTGANSWATQISLTSDGMPYMELVVVPMSEADEEIYPGAVKLKLNGTFYFTGGNNRTDYPVSNTYLFRDSEASGYIDHNSQACWYWTFVKAENGNYYWHSAFNAEDGTVMGTFDNAAEQYAQGNGAGSGVSFDADADAENIEWAFIPVDKLNQEALQTYSEEKLIYDVRLNLRDNLISAATVYDLDYREASAVYLNSEATLDELRAANDALSASVSRATLLAMIPRSSEDNPLDITQYTIENPDFENGQAPWTITESMGQNLQVQTAAYTNWDVDPVVTVRNWIESWTPQPGALNNGVICQTVKGLPEGRYRIECDAIAVQQYGLLDISEQDGIYLFYNNGSYVIHGDAISTGNGMPEHFTFDFDYSGAEEMTIGLMAENTNCNWMGMDNFRLYAIGAMQNDPARQALEAAVAQAEELAAQFGDNNIDEISDTTLNISNEAREFFIDAVAYAQDMLERGEDYQGAIDMLANATAKIKYSVAFYQEYQLIYQDAMSKYAKIEKEAEHSQNTEWYTLAKEIYYFAYDDLRSPFNQGELCESDIEAYRYYVDQRISAFIDAGHIVPGDNLSLLLNNPSFETGDLTGWEIASGTVTVSGQYYNAEAWHQSFDMYQTLRYNLPAGTYRITVQGFVRIDGGENTLVLYAGSSERTLKLITDEYSDYQILGDSTESTVWPYDIPNQVRGGWQPNSMLGAKMWFETTNPETNQPYYLNEVTITHRGGELTIGLRTTSTQLWALWDNFGIEYVGESLLGALIEDIMQLGTEIEALKNSELGIANEQTAVLADIILESIWQAYDIQSEDEAVELKDKAIALIAQIKQEQHDQLVDNLVAQFGVNGQTLIMNEPVYLYNLKAQKFIATGINGRNGTGNAAVFAEGRMPLCLELVDTVQLACNGNAYEGIALMAYGNGYDETGIASKASQLGLQSQNPVLNFIHYHDIGYNLVIPVYRINQSGEGFFHITSAQEGYGQYLGYDSDLYNAYYNTTTVTCNVPETDDGSIDWAIIPAKNAQAYVDAIRAQYRKDYLYELFYTGIGIYDGANLELKKELGNSLETVDNALYGQDSITVDELDTLCRQLNTAINKARFSTIHATSVNPLYVTEVLRNPSFDTGDASGWDVEGLNSAYNLGYQSAAYYNDEAYLSQFIEAWLPTAAGTGLGDGAIKQTIYGLPAGNYILSADINASSDDNTTYGVSLFAQYGSTTAQTPVTTSPEQPQHVEVSFTLDDTSSDLTIGVMLENATANWVAADNFQLLYLGNGDDALLGDASMDGVVDIVDVTTIVDFILMRRQPASEQQFANADVNGDGSIDIADLTSTVSIIQGTYSALVKAERTAVAANDMLIQDGAAFKLLNATGYVAFQADVTLASGAELQGVELSRRADDHVVTFHRTGENTYRIIAYSLSNSAFAGSEGELFKLNIAGEQNANISDAVFTDGYRSCLLTVANEATDIDAITNAASAAQCYDLSGRRVLTPQKGGIYVVNGKTVRVK